jgi:hypothetical protein
MEQAARPEPSAPGVYIDGKLTVLDEGTAGFEAARRHALVGAGGIEIKKESTAGQICSSAAPITTQLSAMPEVPDFSTWQSENRSAVEVRQKRRGPIS